MKTATVAPLTPDDAQVLRARLLRIVERRSALFYSPRCPHCRGRVDITVTHYGADGHIKCSRGECRTHGCLKWED